ncbi:WD40 repeat [Amycolatopsis xylanica]|uniref:WD40 repeat n=1 Tax=Amycolatopsis xylanica TaxID=589385 RepID=A0A1H2SLR1_9PSEU|nr:caspase family protein [Amycolatopsis xylanica]SDW32613.1 WD40 repeat [Amycolatopsis xylanica]
MTDLSGDGVRVLLIATATHHGPTLPSVPSVTRTFEDLRTVLREKCGVQQDGLVGVLDPPDAQSMALAVTEQAQRAETVLVVYFIGHGLLDAGGELYLAASGTDRLVPGMAEHQALSFSTLRQALEASRATSVVVVLDCCFSGKVSLGGRSTVPAFTQAPGYGMYLIGSAEQLALAPPEATHTAFTGALLELLTGGDARGPHALTLDAVYDAVFRTMRDRQRPLPRRQAGDRSGSLVIAPNPAIPAQPEQADEPPHPGRCPYPGLDAFGTDDSDVFFGRERMTGTLLTAVMASADQPGPRILIGPSGSGKTSLLNAGLLACLHQGGLPGLPGSASWPVLRFTPAANPVNRLVTQLNAVTLDAAGLVREDPGRAVALVDDLLADRPDARLIVLVDQLEELFTLCPDPSERDVFLRAITAITQPVRGNPPRALVVLALRADFYGEAAAHPELLAALRDHQVLVEPMTSEELRAAIERPAAAAGLVLDDGLADVILHELGATTGGPSSAAALPLLSHALWATWRQRTATRLTFAGYRASGGITQAIATTAEQVYTSLDEPGREATRLMLPRLVRVGESNVDTARPVERSTLVHGLPDLDAAQRAIDKFTEARLLTLDRDTTRVSHEALLSAWRRLREWIDADRDWLHVHQQLADDAKAWEQSGRDEARLYRGNRLTATRERAAQAPTGATDLEPVLVEFLTDSWQHERRAVRRKRLSWALLGVLVLLTSIGLTGTIAFQRQASQAENRDLARYLAAEAESLRDKQPGLAKQLSLLSYRLHPEAGRGAVLNSQRTPGVINEGEPASDIVHSTDGRVLAIPTTDGVVIRAKGVPDPGRTQGTRTGPIALNPGGTLLAVTDNDKSSAAGTTTLRLWDLADPSAPRPIAASTVDGTVTSVAFGADSGTLYTGMSAGEIRVWDIRAPAKLEPVASMRAHSTQVDSLAVSPRRDLIASASVDGRIQLWGTADSAHPVLVTAFDERDLPQSSQDVQLPLHRVAFDPAGSLLATPGSRQTGPHVWRLDDPHAPRLVPYEPDDEQLGGRRPSPCGSSDSVRSVAFSPSDNRVVVTCGGGWHLLKYTPGPDIGALSPGASVSPGARIAYGAAVFDPSDGRRLLQATGNGVYVWDVANADQPGALVSLPSQPYFSTALDFGSDGRRQLLVVKENNATSLWDVTDMAHPAKVGTSSFPHRGRYAAEVSLSPDGTILAAGEPADGERLVVHLRDTRAPGMPAVGTIGDIANGVAALAFHPTKPILAVSDGNTAAGRKPGPPAVRLYDITDPRNPRKLAQIPVETYQMAFSADGATLVVQATVGEPPRNRQETNQEIHGWDVSDTARPAERWRLPLPPDAVYPTFALRPDGKMLAVSFGATVRLWRAEGGRPTTTAPVSVTRIDTAAMTFSPDGTRLAFIARNRNAAWGLEDRPEVWNVSDPDSPQLQFYLPARLFEFETLAFSPDGRTIAVTRSSPSDRGVDLWDSDPERILTTLCTAAGDPITPRQWQQYLPDRAYQPLTCP